MQHSHSWTIRGCGNSHCSRNPGEGAERAHHQYTQGLCKSAEMRLQLTGDSAAAVVFLERRVVQGKSYKVDRQGSSMCVRRARQQQRWRACTER